MLLVLVTACLGYASTIIFGRSKAPDLTRFSSAEDQALATKYLDLLRDARFDLIEPDLDIVARSSDAREKLTEAFHQFPDEDPESVRLVGVNTFHSADEAKSTLTYEYKFAMTWVLAAITLHQTGGVSRVAAIGIARRTQSLEQNAAFTFAGKGAGQFLFLLVGMGSLGLSFYAALTCIQTNLHRKWPWFLLTLLGVGKVLLNWNTAAVYFQPIFIGLPPFSATAQPYDPWIFSCSIPLGAILFLALNRSRA